MPILERAISRIARVANRRSARQAAPPANPNPPESPKEKLDAMWPKLEADILPLQDIAHQITPNIHLNYKLYMNCIAAPAVNTGAVMQGLADRIPANVKHLLAVPWLGISGGSEKIGRSLLQVLKQHYDPGKVCVLIPDSTFAADTKANYGVPVVAINEFDTTLDADARTEIFDRLMIQFRPRTVHTVNSDMAWIAFAQRGKYYAEDSKLFGSVYSDIRVDTLPVGAFWRHVPNTINCMSGIIADNASIIDRAVECFGFHPGQRAKFHVLPAPVIGHRSELKDYQPSSKKHSLWMSRIAREKRLDVLRDMALLEPDRDFSIYGATIEGAFPIDLSWIENVPNVQMRGAFESLSSLPISDFDSYVFTTSAEGMPISLLEIAMLGLPIVAPAIGGIGEFIDRETGWLIPKCDDVNGYLNALESIRNNPSEARRRVVAAQDRVFARHSWSNFRQVLADMPGYLNEGASRC